MKGYKPDFEVGFPVFLAQLKLLMKGGVKMTATIMMGLGGYQVGLLNLEKFQLCVLHSERSKKPRVFKTAESALKVCKGLGFSSVTIHLQ